MNQNEKCLLPDFTREKAKNALRPPPPISSLIPTAFNNFPLPYGTGAEKNEKRPPINAFSRIYSKNGIKHEEISKRSMSAMLEDHLTETDEFITVDHGLGNSCKLPSSCQRNYNQSHKITILLRYLAEGKFMIDKLTFDPSAAYTALDPKFYLPRVFIKVLKVRHIIRFHEFSHILINFNPHEVRADISLLRNKHSNHAAEIDALLFTIRYISYLKALLLVTYRTEEFNEISRMLFCKRLEFSSQTRWLIWVGA